uniref:SGNH hydrolase-type esterase domain-containing protein n=1 Tax=Oryzias melastigma TaxID=30732 RepID=A0A3B3BEA3_ORYME
MSYLISIIISFLLGLLQVAPTPIYLHNRFSTSECVQAIFDGPGNERPEPQVLLKLNNSHRFKEPQIKASEADWPSLPTRQRTSSTPLHWRTVKKPSMNGAKTLQNRFTPLSDDPGLPNDHPLEGSTRRTCNPSEGKRAGRKLKARPETLIVGDSTVKDVQWFCSRNTKVLCFPNDMVSDMQERILQTVAKYPSVQNIVLHTGSNDVSNQKSEVLKQDFTGLIRTVSSMNAAVFISGPIPTIRGGEERFSRLLALNRWLSATCGETGINFINNFHIFWERVKLFSSNLFHFLTV